MFDNLPLTVGGLFAIAGLIGAVLMAYRWGMEAIGAAEDRAIAQVAIAKAASDLELRSLNDRLSTLQIDVIKNYATYTQVEKTTQRIESAIEKLGARFEMFGSKFNELTLKLVDKMPGVPPSV